MRKEWEIVELEKYINLIDYRGRTPVKTDSGVRLITAKNVKLGYLQLEPEEFIAENNYESWMTRGIPDYGDVIFTTEAPLANVAQITTHEKLAFAQRIIVMQPKRKKLYPKFLKFLLLSPDIRTKILNNGTGATVVGIKSKLLKKIPIPIPPLPEQQQIVSILDKAFVAIDQAKANIEKNIENAKELFKSKLNEIFNQKREGWEEKRLGEVCKYEKFRHNGNLLPYVGLENIESNTGKYLGDFEPTKVKSSTFSFSSKHVLYGRLRPYLNKVLLPDFDGHCSTEIFPILPNSLVDKKYLFYWFLSPTIVKKIDATWTGARMPRANMNDVINFKIRIPSINIQKQITQDLDALMCYTFDIEFKYKRKLQHLEELKKSILQKAFTGELTAKEIAL